MKNKMMKWVTAACMFVMAGSMSVSAAGLEDFNDYQDSDGTYAYYFDQGIIVGGLSEEFYQNTIMIADTQSASFYHKASYEKYLEEGMENQGRLFTIRYSVNHDFADLDEMTYIGYDEENFLNYYAVKPTDYKAYAKDEAVRQQYDALMKESDKVIQNVQILNADKTPSESAPLDNELYQYMENDDLRVEIPAHWKWNDEDGLLFASENGDESEPWIMVAELDGELDAGEQVVAWKQDIQNTYKNRLASEPEMITYVPASNSGRKIAGVKSEISSEDGMRTVTLIDMVEYIDDDLFAYGCAYISNTYGENEHEDETTYFAFEHMLDSMGAKGHVQK